MTFLFLLTVSRSGGMVSISPSVAGRLSADKVFIRVESTASICGYYANSYIISVMQRTSKCKRLYLSGIL